MSAEDWIPGGGLYEDFDGYEASCSPAGLVEADRGGMKAIRCIWRSSGVSRWVPRSQIHPESDVHESGDRGMLRVTPWLHDKLREEGVCP